MTRDQFYATFWGPHNYRNRGRLCNRLGIVRFDGYTVRHSGWSCFMAALGYHYNLLIRDFSCLATFEDALAAKITEDTK